MGTSAGLIRNIEEEKNANLIKKNGAKLFLQESEESRRCFIDYYESGEWTGKLENSYYTNNNNSNEVTEVTEIEHSNRSIYILKHYILPDYISDDLSQQIDQLSSNENSQTKEFFASTLFSLPDKPTSDLIIETIFPIFLESDKYKAFIEKKASRGFTDIRIIHSAIPPEEISNDVTTRDERLDSLLLSEKNDIFDAINNAINSVDNREKTNISSLFDRLGDFLGTVENLDICISVATARFDRPGFPLIYVNKAFEEATGYYRNEIVGKNCKFLQSEKSEKSSITRMIKALKTAQPIKVVISNRRKDGTDFTNLLALKPVFNSKGVYSFVIGVQYDLSQEKTHIQQVKLVDDLLSILPNIV